MGQNLYASGWAEWTGHAWDNQTDVPWKKGSNGQGCWNIAADWNSCILHNDCDSPIFKGQDLKDRAHARLAECDNGKNLNET